MSLCRRFHSITGHACATEHVVHIVCIATKLTKGWSRGQPHAPRWQEQRSARKSLPCLNLSVLQLRRVQAKADAMSTTKATPSSTPSQVRPLPQPLARRMDTPFIFSTVTAFFMTACRLSFSWDGLEKLSDHRDEQPNNSCFSVIVELHVTNYMLAKDPSAFASLLTEVRPSINLISKFELVEQLCFRADSRFAEYMVRSRFAPTEPSSLNIVSTTTAAQYRRSKACN
jgi:hypothetical protein